VTLNTSTGLNRCIVSMQTLETGEIRVPILFGPVHQELFGCYHYPGETMPEAAVVLCYPFGQEYIRAHRSFLQLAKRLVDGGSAVLRFDYSCTGDSAGAAEDSRIERWVADVGCAVDELRSRSGIDRLCLVGLRLGASIAFRAAIDRDGIDSLVLWDPVVDGVAHLAELRSLQHQLLRFGNVSTRNSPGDPASGEVLGFPLPAALANDIGMIDLVAQEPPNLERILLIESGDTTQTGALISRLAERGDMVHQHLEGPRIWLAEPHHAIVPNEVLNSIVTWISPVAR
jgi:uncharacterized protein